jgi:hypothetical protein
MGGLYHEEDAFNVATNHIQETLSDKDCLDGHQQALRDLSFLQTHKTLIGAYKYFLSF